MTKQAQVGAFAIVSLLLLFGIFYYITDFGTRHTGYQIGVRFRSAAGLTPGALVYFSGVNAGSVAAVTLLPDNTVDVILAIKNDINIPAASKFIISAPVTGSPQVTIVPPNTPPPFALLPRSVMPVDQQPQGTNTATLADLLQQGQGQLKRLDTVVGEFAARTPKLLNTLQSTLDNADALTSQMRVSMSQLSGTMLSLGSSLQSTLGSAGANVEQLSATLNATASRNSQKIDTLLDQLQATSVSLNKAMAQIASLASNPNVKANVLATTRSIADTTQTLAALLHDMRTVTANPGTQAQVRDTVANLDAIMQKANSLLGQLGGTSSVYGVDRNATPPPGSPRPPAGTAPKAAAAPLPAASRARLRGKLSALAKNLVALQVRLSGLSPQHATCCNPVLGPDRGPQSDINATILPHGSTSAMFGANDIGYRTTWNALLLKDLGAGVRLGGGVLYSQFGVLGRYGTLTNSFGVEARLYDPRYPMLDLNGSFKILPGTELFFGQRDMMHATRRNVYGLQYTL
jgi:ABC-type transporter Mla subunit MlaD